MRVRKEIDRLINDRSRADEVKLALSLGTAASEDDAHEVALRYLLWAKHLAPRSVIVRESLAIALYRAEDLKGALAELQAYRRLSGSSDQNHLLADCIRSEGRDLDRAIEVAQELAGDERQEMERRVEAAIVIAAVQLEQARPERARTALQPFLADGVFPSLSAESAARLLWMEADVAEARRSVEDAVDALTRLRSIDAAYPDVDLRLTRLRAGADG